MGCTSCKTSTCKGCGSQAESLDQVCNAVECETEQCSEVYGAGCIVLEGADITAGSDTVSEAGDSVDAILREMVRLFNSRISTVKISLTAAQIKDLNTTPILAIASPGVGKALVVTSVNTKYNYNTAAFTSSTLSIYADTLSVDQGTTPANFLQLTANRFSKIDLDGTSGTSIIEDKGIYIKANADSASGDSTIDVYITYETITI
jgi:hypothetical protein